MLCDVAYSRAHGTATFILPTAADAMEATREERKRAETADIQPGQGLPPQVAAALATPVQPGTCGSCRNFDGDALCRARDLRTRAKDRACFIFKRRSRIRVKP
jgi:hypothetical protein